MHHSGRGSPYGSSEYVAPLERFGFVRSMSHKGNCWDNAVAESFFSTLEHECIQGRVSVDIDHVRAVLADYLGDFYNPGPLAVRVRCLGSRCSSAKRSLGRPALARAEMLSGVGLGPHQIDEIQGTITPLGMLHPFSLISIYANQLVCTTGGRRADTFTSGEFADTLAREGIAGALGMRAFLCAVAQLRAIADVSK